MRMIYGVILLCLLLSFWGNSVYAQENKVNDGADLLTEKEETKLQERLEKFVEKYDCDIAVTTVHSTGGKTPARYAEDFYESQGYGVGSEIDGLMLLVSMEERDWYIVTYGTAISAFTDYGIQQIGDIIVEPLGDGKYYKAFAKFADLADTFMKEAENEEPYDIYHEYEEPMPLGLRLLISAVVGLAAAVIVLIILCSQLRSVGYEKTAVDYVKKGSFRLHRQKDLYLYRNVTRTKIEHDTSHSGGGGLGGSSTHTTSGGHTAGGGGGKF